MKKKDALLAIEPHDVEDRFVIVRYGGSHSLRPNDMNHVNRMLLEAGARQVLFDHTDTKIETYSDEQLRLVGLTRLN